MTPNIVGFSANSFVDLPTAITALNIIVAAQIATILALAPANLTSIDVKGFSCTDLIGPGSAASAAIVLAWVTP